MQSTLSVCSRNMFTSVPRPLDEGKKTLRLSRIMGRLSAIFFVLALFTGVDSLQTSLRQPFNHIDLVAGENTLISGPLPQDIENHEAMQISITGENGLSLVPLQTYRGFWFGGNMWRGQLEVDKSAVFGKSVVTVHDFYQVDEATTPVDENITEKTIVTEQNPTLVYTVTVWPTKAALDAASVSILQRFAGVQGYMLALVAAAFALTLGVLNWFFFCKAEGLFCSTGVFVLHGCRQEDGVYTVLFSLNTPTEASLETSIFLYDRDWNLQGRAKIATITGKIAEARVTESTLKPCYGWFVSLMRI